MAEEKGRRALFGVRQWVDISRANRRAPNIYHNDRRPDVVTEVCTFIKPLSFKGKL